MTSPKNRNATLTRRKLVAGVAWAAPAVATSATIPAYAASVAATKDCILATSPAYSISGTDEGAKTVKTELHRSQQRP
mgnify:CR=1 FL=1